MKTENSKQGIILAPVLYQTLIGTILFLCIGIIIASIPILFG